MINIIVCYKKHVVGAPFIEILDSIELSKTKVSNNI